MYSIDESMFFPINSCDFSNEIIEKKKCQTIIKKKLLKKSVKQFIIV